MTDPSRNTSNSSIRSRSGENRRRRNRRRRTANSSGSHNNDFDQACEFLHHFHTIASTSLDAIAEHSESSGDDYYEHHLMDTSPCRLASPSTTNTRRIRKATTCASLSSLEVAAVAAETFSDHSPPALTDELSHHHHPQQQQVDDDDEWGFYFEEMSSPESSMITPKRK